MKSWLAQGSSRRQVTILPGTPFFPYKLGPIRAASCLLINMACLLNASFLQYLLICGHLLTFTNW